MLLFYWQAQLSIDLNFFSILGTNAFSKFHSVSFLHFISYAPNHFPLQVQQAIQVASDEHAYTEQRIKESKDLRDAAVLYPIHSGSQILQLHKYFTKEKVKQTFSSIRKLQTDIQKTIPNLPPGM